MTNLQGFPQHHKRQAVDPAALWGSPALASSRRLERHARALRTTLAALRPHNREQILATARWHFKAIGFPIGSWPTLVRGFLSGQLSIIIDKHDRRPWPLWEFLALATGVDFPAECEMDRSDPVMMMAAWPLPWAELLDLCCDVLSQPPPIEPEPILSRPRRQLDDRKRIRESRVFFATTGPPTPDSSDSYHDQGTTARRGRALYFSP